MLLSPAEARPAGLYLRFPLPPQPGWTRLPAHSEEAEPEVAA